MVCPHIMQLRFIHYLKYYLAATLLLIFPGNFSLLFPCYTEPILFQSFPWLFYIFHTRSLNLTYIEARAKIIGNSHSHYISIIVFILSIPITHSPITSVSILNFFNGDITLHIWYYPYARLYFLTIISENSGLNIIVFLS